MKPQIHLTERSSLVKGIVPVSNTLELPVKPKGGLWTSSYVNRTCSWAEASEEMFGVLKRNWFLLEPKPDVKIYTVDNLEDLSELLDRFSVEPFGNKTLKILRYPDFERIAEVYDGIHLSEAGQWNTRLTFPDSLYGWDCECTLWLRHWPFLSVTKIEAPKLVQKL